MTNALYRQTDYARATGAPGVRSDEPGRKAFRKDYSRLLHAASFRRLQGKTQLYPGSESDYFRNRLTHSLEVAQIAQGIAALLNEKEVPAAFPDSHIDEDLVQFAALAHDIGHPPFGHNGEHALDQKMRRFGGFEGNAQSLRIVAAVERKLVQVSEEEARADRGLDLTYRALASLIKYDHCIAASRTKSKLEKGYYSTESALVKDIKTAVLGTEVSVDEFKTVECAIMDLADDIAYSTYDLEDTLHAGFLTPTALMRAMKQEPVKTSVVKKVNKALSKNGYGTQKTDSDELVSTIATVFDVKMGRILKGIKSDPTIDESSAQALAYLDAHDFDRTLIDNTEARVAFTARRVGNLINSVRFVPNLDHPALSAVKLERDALLQVEVFKHLNYEIVVRSPRLAVVEYRGKDIVAGIFDALASTKGTLLPSDWVAAYRVAEKIGEAARLRVICDYVACMTDRYAAELFGRLFGEGSTMFKPL